jgi:hypothetical protein
VPFVCSETNELGEELVGSFLYQVHLHHDSNSTSPTAPVRQRCIYTDIKVKRMVCLLDRSGFEIGRNSCAAQVSRGQFQAFCSRSPKHTDLVTQSQVLELEGGARSEDRRQSREECHKSSEHRRNYERCNSHPFRSFEVFERHT